MALVANDEFEQDCYFSMLNSQLYEFIVTTARWSGFLHKDVIRGLPKLPMKIWNDDVIFDYFELTPEERAYVSACVKKNS